MPKDRQEIIAVLDQHQVGQYKLFDWASYRETIADQLMALPDVGDEPLRELLSYCKTQSDTQHTPHDAARLAYADVHQKLTEILDGER